MHRLQKAEAPFLRHDYPFFRPGDTVAVDFLIEEGKSQRIQRFTGIVIKRRRSGLGSTFTVRRVVAGFGVERIFPLHSPRIRDLAVVRYGRVRRGNLAYLRQRSGRKARISESKPRFVSVIRESEDSRGFHLSTLTGPDGELFRAVSGPSFTSCYWPVSGYGVCDFLAAVDSMALAPQRAYLAFNDGSDTECQFESVKEDTQKTSHDVLDFIRVYGDGLDLTFDTAIDKPHEGLLGAFLPQNPSTNRTEQILDLFWNTSAHKCLYESVRRRLQVQLSKLTNQPQTIKGRPSI